MGDAHDFKAEGFELFKETQDKATVQFMDDTQEIPYIGKCYINAKKTIGYIAADIKDKHEFIFVSKTAKGSAMTMSAEKEGPLPFKEEGIYVVFGTPQDLPVETMYEMHRRALGPEAPLVAEEWLKETVPHLPQTMVNIAMTVMNQMLEALGGADGLMQALGDAMAGAIEGIGKGMGEAMQGLGGPQEGEPTDEKPDEPAPPEEPVNPPPWEAGPKKAPPKRAPPKKATPKKKPAPKKATPKKKPAPKKATPKKKPAPKKAPPKKKAKAKPKAKPKKGKKKR